MVMVITTIAMVIAIKLDNFLLEPNLEPVFCKKHRSIYVLDSEYLLKVLTSLYLQGCS